MDRRKGYTRDIDAEDVLILPVAVVIILVLVVLFISFIIWIAEDPKATADQHNAIAVEYNALSFAERQTVYKFNTDLAVDEETYLMAIVEPDLTIGEWYAAHWKILLIILLCAYSSLTFFSYWKEKSSEYYLCDLPLSKAYGWFLFFSMFIAWPLLLLNWVYMQTFSKLAKKLREQRRIKREENAAERQAIRDLADNWTAEPELSLRFPAAARQAYITYVKKGAAAAQAERIKQAQESVDYLKQRLAEAGQTVKQIQSELGAARAKLNNLEAAKLNCKTATTQATKEWETLISMQGVSLVKVHKRRGNKNVDLNILVKVRVPYEAETYDFGDYMIRLSGNRFSCKEIRSGVKRNARSSKPYYNESNGFCFGSRKSTIEEYLNHGCILEALDLMIECLHSVNSESAEREIPNCFRKVKTIERVQRWQQFKRKFLLQKEG